jgi:hypothetical protein
MTSKVNNCNKLDDLTKYPKNPNTTPALSQGKQFNKYKSKRLHNYLEKESNIEGMTNPGSGSAASAAAPGSGPAVTQDISSLQEIPAGNKLATETAELIQTNEDLTDGQRAEVDKLRDEYNDALIKFQDLMARINGSSNNYLNRVNNNPYLGKNIRFTTGHVCYVTQQGVVKHIPNPSIWDSIADKNMCPGKTYVDVSMPWLAEYNTPGTEIKALNLITGTPMVVNQSCGFAGKNVYVNTLVNNPQSRYAGCFNDKPSSTDILFVPVMNSSNNVNGYISRASSIYLNNNGIWGPWTAFNRVADPYWHSDGGNNMYNSSTGDYRGVNYWDYRDANGNNVRAKGEWLWIECGPGNVLTKYDLQGRQGCCGTPNARTPNSWIIIGGVYNQPYELVDKRDNQGLSYETRTYSIRNPKRYNHYIFLTTNCGVPGTNGDRGTVQIAQWNLYTSSDYNFNNNQRAMIWNEAAIGYTDLETCRNYAVENGYQYFGLQDGRSNGTAACLMSNDLARSRMYGRAFKFTGVPLWSSKTGRGTGSVALLNNLGALVVNNSAGAAIWTSPNSSGLPGNYFGCYGDCSRGRGLPEFRGSGRNYETCQTIARDNKRRFFGLQFTQPNGTSECWTGDDINAARSMGRAGNCTKLNGILVGGGCSNAVYMTNFDANSVINSFLILQDDGNMVIYRGTGPTDNQGVIWATGTNGKQQRKDSNFTAEKSKFGKNWIPNGTTLAAGDFVGSNDGSMYLLMQTDGDLVLYTSTRVRACSTNSQGNRVGGGWVNAIYSLFPAGFRQNIGKIGYVDQENVLHEYDSNNTRSTTEYTRFQKVDTYGNDLPGAAYGNASLDSCSSTCNNNKNCYGYVFDFQNKVCYPKSQAMWPYGGPLRNLNFTDTYVRGKEPISVPTGVPHDVSNIDSVQYQMYVKGKKLQGKYGLANATTAEQAELDRLQAEMKRLSEEIANLTDKYGLNTNKSDEQSVRNIAGINDYEQQIAENERRKSEMDGTSDSVKESFIINNNIDKIVEESDINVLQKNYDYLVWSILAAGSVIVAMNIGKNTS